MMSILLLRLAGPMQSWGTQSRFAVRDTGLEPSKSGVVGLVCAAMGRPRSESVDDLAALKMGIRVDHEGIVKKDFHTAMNVLRASGKGIKDCELSDRYYLADADFLVALKGDNDLLKQIHESLQNPVWQVFLGRKSFVPSMPVGIGDSPVVSDDLEHALFDHPWPRQQIVNLPKSYRSMIDNDGRVELRFVVEADGNDGEEVRSDQPVGRAFQDRTFTIRHTKTFFRTVDVREEMLPCISPA